MKKPAILYDSLCILCNAEIEYYRKNDLEQLFSYIDIMGTDFDSKSYSLTKKEVHKYFHVIREDGSLLKGVEAFNFIWKTLNMFTVLQKLYSLRYGRKIMTIGYHCFVFARPYLPRRKKCGDYCEL
jgi:predicted DCC family thiol-disulfide oxidoreductase YuxK